MRRRIYVAAGIAVFATTVVLLRRQPAPPAPPAARTASATTGAAPAVPSEPALPNAKRGDPVVTRDPAMVFQRAFWRRLTADVQVPQAERREWIDASSGVQRWQWFVAVRTSPAFRAWLFEQNPFELAAVASPADATGPADAPDWFPALAHWPDFRLYRARGGQFTVLLDEKSGRLFACDAGGGFAPPSR